MTKSNDGVLGIRTHGFRMEGGDESTEQKSDSRAFRFEKIIELLIQVIVFVFTSDKMIKSSNISNLVAFEPSKQSGTSTLKVLNFIVTKMLENFDIFFIIPDSVYVNPYRLKGKRYTKVCMAKLWCQSCANVHQPRGLEQEWIDYHDRFTVHT